MLFRRPLRSVMLANPRYMSAYVLGVAQAMGLRGDWHRQVSLFDDAASIDRQIAEMAPDVIWTHMAAWPPPGATTAEDVASILGRWKRRGAVVFFHDGDPRDRTITVDMPASFSMALLNRAVPPGPFWGIPWKRWPYAAMVQREMAAPGPVTHDLLFAGALRRDKEGEPGLYGERTELVWELHRRLWPRMAITSPGGGDINNRMHVADIVGTTHAVLGYGRPEINGWVDTRVFQWPGAGGLLIHDDDGGFLSPGEHYLRFESGPTLDATVESVLRALHQAKDADAACAIRRRAFTHVQQHHTWVNRVDDALAPFFGGRSD